MVLVSRGEKGAQYYYSCVGNTHIQDDRRPVVVGDLHVFQNYNLIQFFVQGKAVKHKFPLSLHHLVDGNVLGLLSVTEALSIFLSTIILTVSKFSSAPSETCSPRRGKAGSFTSSLLS